MRCEEKIRLTTDHPRGNFETLCNYCRVVDGNCILAYADGEEKVGLIEYCNREGRKRGCLNCIIDGEQPECDCEVAVLYAVGTQAGILWERLKKIEDKENGITYSEYINGR